MATRRFGMAGHAPESDGLIEARMVEYGISPDEFGTLVRIASRHHVKQIAEMLGLLVRTVRGTRAFREADGAEVSLEAAHRRSQADAQVRRRTYNLHMHYAHFG